MCAFEKNCLTRVHVAQYSMRGVCICENPKKTTHTFKFCFSFMDHLQANTSPAVFVAAEADTLTTP